MKSLLSSLLLIYLSVFVSVKGEDDAVIVEDDSETSESGETSVKSSPVQTRLFTGNSQLDAGLAGLAIGVGGALVVGHFLGEAEKNNNRVHCQRYKRNAEEPSLRFLNFGGGSGGAHKCPPGTYPVPKQPSYAPGYNTYNTPYPSQPAAGPYYPPSHPSPQPLYPSPTNSYNTPFPSAHQGIGRPTHGPARHDSSPYKQPFRPYQPYAPSQGYSNPGSPYAGAGSFNVPYVQRQSLQSTSSGYRVPSSPVRRPSIDHQGGGSSLFVARSNLKSSDVKATEEKRSDAVRFV